MAESIEGIIVGFIVLIAAVIIVVSHYRRAPLQAQRLRNKMRRRHE